ncbi:hypothetical protein [Sporosarcina sp. YIM B06819]|uniref:hypothetical protein n=1 Tax=Sporosarcina sp. YIM B06819 TaxID=3081769 RepID=UPI00298BFEF8|nr:hypothetical protein [Sporosarcina sp. YIM B06819]
MSPATKKNKEEKKRKTLLLLVLYVATALFTSWLLFVLLSPFFFAQDETKDQPFADFKVNLVGELPSSLDEAIVEIGGVDNTLDDIQRTTEALAVVLSDYYFHREQQ